MKKVLFAALVLGSFHTMLAAQTAPDPVARLRDGALDDQIAWTLIEGITTEVGPRLAGTEAEMRARAWSVARLKALGFSNVHVEDYQMPVWVRGAETAELVGGAAHRLAVTALGNSGSTGDGGLTGQVVGFDSLAALAAAPAGSLEGKIVFLSHSMQATQDGSSYAYFGPHRFAGPAIAASKGAAAILVRSLGTDNHRLPHTGVTSFPQGTAAIPAAAVSIPDADLLQRLLGRREPVTLRLLLTPRQIGSRTSGNVVAEVPGSDPDAGIILVGGHLDSWDLGTGAIDDAAGIAITAAAAKRVMDAPGRPRRTIRLVWWGSEEVGGFGANAYFARHKDEKIVLVAESDFGADRVWRMKASVAAGNKALVEALAESLAPLGISHAEGPAHGGADIAQWVAAGAAVIDLDQDGTRYFDLHHTADDTLDKIDRAQLGQNVAAWTAMLALVASRSEPIARVNAK